MVSVVTELTSTQKKLHKQEVKMMFKIGIIIITIATVIINSMLIKQYLNGWICSCNAHTNCGVLLERGLVVDAPAKHDSVWSSADLV